MSGANRPVQQTFDPTPPALRPLQGLLGSLLMNQIQTPVQGVPMGGLPNAGSIFGQLYGGSQQPQGGGLLEQLIQMGSPMIAGPPRPAVASDMSPYLRGPIGPVSSGSRMIRSAPGGNVPTFGQLFYGRQRGY
jgi:hypothetical protein